MKNRSNIVDAELKKQMQGLNSKQIRLLASIYAGLAEQFRKKNTAESLAKWKDREDYSNN